VVTAFAAGAVLVPLGRYFCRAGVWARLQAATVHLRRNWDKDSVRLRQLALVVVAPGVVWAGHQLLGRIGQKDATMPAMTFAAVVKSLAVLLLLAASLALSNISALFVCQIIAHSVWTIKEMATRWSELVADESSPRERHSR
jgi:hypothetical protein